MKIIDCLKLGREKLENKKIESAKIDSELLMMEVLKLEKSGLRVRMYDEISDIDSKKFMKLIKRREKDEPVAYILGNKEFMGLEFKVDKNVLIPRPDTEILVEETLKVAKEGDTVIDMCTGSGCIGISIAKFLKDSKVTCVDISKKALSIARYNAGMNRVEAEFIHSNLFKSIKELKGKVDVIVSNPPYIETKVVKGLDKTVRKFEPNLALDGGKSGLEFYIKIINEAKSYLKKDGYLTLEIGYDQHLKVREILENDYYDIKLIKDYSDNDRVIIARRK